MWNFSTIQAMSDAPMSKLNWSIERKIMLADNIWNIKRLRTFYLRIPDKVKAKARSAASSKVLFSLSFVGFESTCIPSKLVLWFLFFNNSLRSIHQYSNLTGPEAKIANFLRSFCLVICIRNFICNENKTKWRRFPEIKASVPSKSFDISNVAY